MLRNYLKTALRNLRRHRAFSLINVFGLALGMAACLLIFQYVSFELSYDTFHRKGDRIYRLVFWNEGRGDRSARTSAPVGATFRNNFPEIASFARLYDTGGTVTYGESGRTPVAFREAKVFFADSAFLSMFSFPLVKGNASTALTEPNTIAISHSTAQKYFGREEPLGKVLTFYDYNFGKKPCVVKAVFEDVPVHSHLQFDMLVSMVSAGGNGNFWADFNSYGWGGFHTYVLLKPGVDVEQLKNKFPAFIEKFMWQEFKERDASVRFGLQPLADLHLRSSLNSEPGQPGSIQLVYFLGIVALFILVIAWVNYVNLSTARSMERAREVGVRKVIGATRGQLIRQFLMESVLLNLTAVYLAMILVELSMPWFRELTGKPLTFLLSIHGGAGQFRFWLPLGLLFSLGALLSGLYPAFVLSAYRPIAVLKGKLAATRQGTVLRKSLVVFQFVASVGLMAGTFIVYQQLHYMRNKSLGMNIDRLLVINSPGVTDSTYNRKKEVFYNALLRQHAVSHVSYSGQVPGQGFSFGSDSFSRPGEVRPKENAGQTKKGFQVTSIDTAFLNTYQIPLLAGRNFRSGDGAYGSPLAGVILNESAVRLFGFASSVNAVNQIVLNGDQRHRIVGVVKDYHHESLRKDYVPTIFYGASWGGTCSVRIRTGSDPVRQLTETIAFAKRQYEDLYPGNPFEYFFLDEYFDSLYKSDRQFGKVFGLFSALAIIVAGLGLFGLASFSTTQRTKEIGIRKVFGASVSDIVLLLSRDFVKLVLLACLIALPLTYFGMNKWLENYAFRIRINGWLLAVPGLLVLLIALFTVSYQTFRAARSNPVDSLRTE